MKYKILLWVFCIGFSVNLFSIKKSKAVTVSTKNETELTSGQILKKIAQGVVDTIDNQKILLAMMITNFFPIPRPTFLYEFSNIYGSYAILKELSQQVNFQINNDENLEREEPFEEMSLVKFSILRIFDTVFFIPVIVALRQMEAF